MLYSCKEAGLLGSTFEYELPIQLPFQQSIIFINQTSTLRFHHQFRFHGHYVFIINPASTYNVMRQHNILARIPCMNQTSISVKDILSFYQYNMFLFQLPFQEASFSSLH